MVPTTEIGPLEVGPIAHGGHCVARHPTDQGGRVIFVRHALPGERVRVLITDDAMIVSGGPTPSRS